MPGKVVNKKIKKRGTDVKLDVAKVLVFFFDALYTLIIVAGQYKTNGNFAKRARIGIFIGFAIEYGANALLLTVVIWSITVLVKKRIRLAIQMICKKCCKGCCKACSFHTTSCAVLKKVSVLIIEIMVIIGVVSYFIGDNLNDVTTNEGDDPTTLSKVVSAILIIGGLLLIYFFSYAHTRVKEFDSKKEKTREDLTEKGQIAKSQESESKNNKRNAEIFKKTYEFILHIFGLIPFIDGIFTSILEVEDPCEHKSFYIALWVLYGVILLILAIYLIVYASQLVRDITQQEIEVSTVKGGSKIVGGKITNIGGTVTCTYNRQNASSDGKTITITECAIEIEGGTTLSNNQATIFGEKITITGGKQENKRGGTRIIEEGNITTKGGELIFNNGKVKTDTSTFYNIGGTHTPIKEQNRKHILKIKGGITTINGGTATFTADSATITGGEVTAINKEQQGSRQQKRNPVSSTCRYDGLRMEKLKYLVPLVVITSIFNFVCIGLFLIADNNQPLDCSRAKAGSEANYRIRIAFISVALLLYIISMSLVSGLWGIFQFWAGNTPENPEEEDEPPPKRPRRRPVESSIEEIELNQLSSI